MKHLNIIYSLIGLLTVFVMPLVFAGSFSGPADDVPERQTPTVGGEHKVISIAYYPEWEPGMVSEIRQISIDNSGAGQVSVKVDNVLTSLSTFRYQADIFYRWHKRAVSTLADLYVSTELEQQGIVVEGNAESHKFYFLYPYFSKIVDTEPGYAKTPAELTELADDVNALSRVAQASELDKQYFIVTPLGDKRSLQIVNRFASTSTAIPTVAEVRNMLDKDQRIAIDNPSWLVVMPDKTSEKIKSFFRATQANSLKRNFFYAKAPQCNVVKMEFLDAR